MFSQRPPYRKTPSWQTESQTVRSKAVKTPSQQWSIEEAASWCGRVSQWQGPESSGPPMGGSSVPATLNHQRVFMRKLTKNLLAPSPHRISETQNDHIPELKASTGLGFKATWKPLLRAKLMKGAWRTLVLWTQRLNGRFLVLNFTSGENQLLVHRVTRWWQHHTVGVTG